MSAKQEAEDWAEIVRAVGTARDNELYVVLLDAVGRGIARRHLQ